MRVYTARVIIAAHAAGLARVYLALLALVVFLRVMAIMTRASRGPWNDDRPPFFGGVERSVLRIGVRRPASVLGRRASEPVRRTGVLLVTGQRARSERGGCSMGVR